MEYYKSSCLLLNDSEVRNIVNCRKEVKLNRQGELTEVKITNFVQAIFHNIYKFFGWNEEYAMERSKLNLLQEAGRQRDETQQINPDLVHKIVNLSILMQCAQSKESKSRVNNPLPLTANLFKSLNFNKTDALYKTIIFGNSLALQIGSEILSISFTEDHQFRVGEHVGNDLEEIATRLNTKG